jgi:hypothetical protein
VCAAVGAANHWHGLEVYTMHNISNNMLKKQSCNEPVCTKIAGKMPLKFSCDSATYSLKNFPMHWLNINVNVISGISINTPSV